MGYFDGFDSTPTRGSAGDPSTGSDAPTVDTGGDSDGGGGGGSDFDSGGGGGGGGGGNPMQPDADPVPVSDITDPVNNAVDAIADPVTDAVDFVTSGPDEPSVGDPEFNDPGTPEVDVPGGDDPEPDIEPDTPDVGNEFVTDDAAENFSTDQLSDARTEITEDIQAQTPGVDVDPGDLQLDVGDESGTIVARPTDVARTQFTGPEIPAGSGDVPAPGGDLPSAPRSTFSDVGEPDITADPGIIDDATDSGGLLAENRTDTSAVLPGEIGGVNVSEPAVFGTASDIGTAVNERVTQTTEDVDVGPAGTEFGETVADAGGNIIGAFGEAPRAIEGGVEFAQNAPLSDEAVVTAGSTAVDVAQATARQARREPATFAAEGILSFGGGAVAGRAIGTAGRAARRASTRVGGTEIDPTDLTNERTVQFAEGEITDRDARFPGAADEGLYQTDPAASVRRQADEFTPDEIEQRFDEAGVDDATDLKKAVDRNPEGPVVGRGNTGLETREGSYESPGAFAGPELSPNFLRLSDRGSADFSLRPGLPDFGSNPTGVIVRTDVENPDADTLNEFNEELLDAEGETTARTLPADEVNPGEAEAVIPPESQFAPVRGGIGSRLRGRLGVGSDFYTEIDGQAVRLQPVADPDLVTGESRRGLFGDGADRGQVGPPNRPGAGVGDTRRLSEIRRGGDVGTDRPLPAAPVGSPSGLVDSGGAVAPSGPFGSDLGSDFGGSTTPSSGRNVPDDSTTPAGSGSSPSGGSSPVVDRDVFGSFGGVGTRPRGETNVPSGSVPGGSGSFGGFGSFGASQPGSSGRETVPSGGSSSGPSSGSSSGSSAATPGGGGGTPAPTAPPSRPTRPADRPRGDDDPDRERLPVRDPDPVTPERVNPIIGSIADITGRNRREDRLSGDEDPRGETVETGFRGIDAGVFGDFGGVGL